MSFKKIVHPKNVANGVVFNKQTEIKPQCNEHRNLTNRVISITYEI